MELEALVATPRGAIADDWRLDGGTLDLSPFAARLIDQRLTAREAAEGFHAALIAGLAAWIAEAARREQRTRIALGGGCLMNRVLVAGLVERLIAAGFEVACPRLIPANDGGLSFGQAAFALQTLR
jgi:hydrogenase maturation protein HypF